MQNIEVIDLGTSSSAINGNHTVKLNLSDVLDLVKDQTGTISQNLMINGDSGDTVDIDLVNYSTSSTTVQGGITYNVYSNSTLPLSNILDDILVQQGIHVI